MYELSKALKEKSKTNEQYPVLRNTPSWRQLEQLYTKAIEEFPEWCKNQKSIQKTGNLHTWLTDVIGADSREAELAKKVLSDIFSELK